MGRAQGCGARPVQPAPYLREPGAHTGRERFQRGADDGAQPLDACRPGLRALDAEGHGERCRECDRSSPRNEAVAARNEGRARGVRAKS